MKTKELFEKAQQIGKYKVFYFDMVGSRKMSQENRYFAQVGFNQMQYYLVNEFFKLEKQKGHKILVRDYDDDIKETDMRAGTMALCSAQTLTFRDAHENVNPKVIAGDMLRFVTYRNSASDDEIYEMFYNLKEKLTPGVNYHFGSQFYDTHLWVEGSKKLCLTEALRYLDEHKTKTTLDEYIQQKAL